MSRPASIVATTTAVGAMIATPFLPRGGIGRGRLTSVVVGSWFASTALASAARWGGRRAATATSSITLATLAIEAVGTRTGRLFGHYSYTSALRPRVGGVPAVVPLAWAAMAVPARETAHAALGRRSRPSTRIVVGSAALTAWDLFLDPQMLGEGYWWWERTGRYRGVPLTNFVGWFLVGVGLMALLEVVLPPEEADGALVGTYATMAVMETAAFASFLDDALVAIIGGVAMLPMAASAVRRLVGQRP